MSITYCGDIRLLKSISNIPFIAFFMPGDTVILEKFYFYRTEPNRETTSLCFFIISGKSLPFTANKPYFCKNDLPTLLGTNNGRLIHSGTPTTIYNNTQPNDHISTAHGLW